ILYNSISRTMFISQLNTTNTLLERAKMADCNAAPAPCQPGLLFTKQDCPETPDAKDCTDYRKLVALANFISCWTRPDITFTVHVQPRSSALASSQALAALPQGKR